MEAVGEGENHADGGSHEHRFAQLWTLRYDIRGYVRRIGVGYPDHEDVASEVYLHAWRRIEEVPPQRRAAAAWLYQTARNLVSNHRRGHRRESRVFDRDRHHHRALDATRSWSASPPTHTETKAEARMAWSTLSKADQNVLFLVAVAGLTSDEIAKALGCSRPAAAQRLSRARRRLQLALDAS